MKRKHLHLEIVCCLTGDTKVDWSSSFCHNIFLDFIATQKYDSENTFWTKGSTNKKLVKFRT